MSTRDVDVLLGTKEDTVQYGRGAGLANTPSHTGLLLATFPVETRDPFQPAAGHCRTSGMCRQMNKKCLNNGGRGGEPGLLILHPSPGNKRLKPSWRCHLVLWIPHKRADYGQTTEEEEDWDSGIFSWHDTWYTKNVQKLELIWIKVDFHVIILFLPTDCFCQVALFFCRNGKCQKWKVESK